MNTITILQIRAIQKRFCDIVPEHLEHSLRAECFLNIARECIYNVLVKPVSHPNGFSPNGLEAYEPFPLDFARGGKEALGVTVTIGGGYNNGHPLGYRDNKLTVALI